MNSIHEKPNQNTAAATRVHAPSTTATAASATTTTSRRMDPDDNVGTHDIAG